VAVTFAFGALLFSIAEKVLAGYDEGQSFLERMNLGKRMHEGKELRLIIWGDYLKHYDRFLLTGVGAGRAMEVTRDDYSTDLHYNTHNKYLNMAVEFGILGFGLLLAALGAMAWKLLRRFLATRDLWSLCALCLLSAWLALLLLGDYTNSRDYWFYWGFLFFILQAGAGTQAPRPEAAP
jgi:O-antigen ligase